MIGKQGHHIVAADEKATEAEGKAHFDIAGQPAVSDGQADGDEPGIVAGCDGKLIVVRIAKGLAVGKVSEECGVYVKTVVQLVVGTEDEGCGHVDLCGCSSSIGCEALLDDIIFEGCSIAYIICKTLAGEVAIAGNIDHGIRILIVLYGTEIFYRSREAEVVHITGGGIGILIAKTMAVYNADIGTDAAAGTATEETIEQVA